MKRRIRNKQRFLYLSPVVQKGTDELFIDGKGREGTTLTDRL